MCWKTINLVLIVVVEEKVVLQPAIDVSIDGKNMLSGTLIAAEVSNWLEPDSALLVLHGLVIGNQLPQSPCAPPG